MLRNTDQRMSRKMQRSTINWNKSVTSFIRDIVNWRGIQDISPSSFICGHCTTFVTSNKGFACSAIPDGSGHLTGGIYICPNCHGPTIMEPNGRRIPDVPIGRSVEHLPKDVDKIYNEARSCTSIGAYTASVLLCRKLIMHLGVEKGAKENENFKIYVNYLDDKGFIPPGNKDMLDHVRDKGNEANHEITIMSREDASLLLTFIEMLLRFIYEFPAMIPGKKS